MSDISPVITEKRFGNSSIDVALMILPILVTLGSFLIFGNSHLRILACEFTNS
jgi:hypothetical protein